MTPAALTALAASSAFLWRAEAFMPFAGVDELGPKRLHHFCEKGTEGLRWCSHRVERALEDGGDVQMAWDMQVDPDKILSLDTEAEHGVRLAECSPWELRLELPESHAGHAAAGKFVIGSRFVHGCRHLEHRPLYHRITAVKRHEWRSTTTPSPDGTLVRFAHVHLSTEELPNIAHVAPSISFAFSYTPAEARDVVPFPEMRTDYGENRHHLRQSRRLLDFQDMTRNLQDHLHQAEKVAEAKLGEGGAGFQQGSRSSGSVDMDGAPLLNMAPKKVSNFGWNWDFLMNTTEEPEFELNAPGGKGMIKLREPYMKAHAGIFLNFSSEFKGLTETPLVKWTAGLNGHGRMQARVLSMMNTTDAVKADSDEGTEVDLPFMEKFHEAQWFEKIDVAAGSMPMSFEPGIRMNSKLYHKGAYDGVIAAGGRGHGVIRPTMTFDSRNGLDTHFEGELLDSDIWPPMWMIFTRRFELGLMATPTMLMRGDFAGMEKATVAFEMRPFLNITVRREKEQEKKPLTVYPVRAMGLPGGDFGLRYKLAVSAGGQLAETRPRISWGEVAFRDPISDFTVGNLTQKDAETERITIALIKVSDESDDLPTETTIGSGSAACDSLASGVCRVVASILDDSGEGVAAVELAVLWGGSPSSWLASGVRGAAVSFPKLALDKDANLSANETLSLHLFQGGGSYALNVSRKSGGGGLEVTSALEFGPAFAGAWRPCPQDAPDLCQSPRAELHLGTSRVAVGELPEMDSPLNASEPMTVLLHAPGAPLPALAALNVKVVPFAPAESSMVLEPSAGKALPLGRHQELVWTVSRVDPPRAYDFHIQALRLSKKHTWSTSLASMVNGRELEPVRAQFWSVLDGCEQRAVAGIPAGDAPCTFTHRFTVHNKSFSPEDVVVFDIQWQEGGLTRTLRSQPFEVVREDDSSRRLGAVEALDSKLRKLEDWGHELFTPQAWQQKVQQNKESCQERDLHFDIGGGMMARAKMESFEINNGNPNSHASPFPGVLATPWRRVAEGKRGTGSKDLLPEELCADGLCSGALPGCSQHNLKKHFPKMTFNFNRPFHYNKSNEASMEVALRQVMAYAFSALPEMVNVAIKEANRTTASSLFGGTPSTTSTTQTTTSPPTPTSAQPTTKAAAWWAVPQETSTSTPSDGVPMLPHLHSHQQDTDVGKDGQWWPWSSSVTSRRLRDTSSAEPAMEKGHQVSVHFRDGLPYPVDSALVERMIRHGFFMDVKDDAAGPLSITGFALESAEGDDQAHAGAAAPAALDVSKVFVAASSAAAAAGVAALTLWAARAVADKRARYSRQVQETEPFGFSAVE